MSRALALHALAPDRCRWGLPGRLTPAHTLSCGDTASCTCMNFALSAFGQEGVMYDFGTCRKPRAVPCTSHSHVECEPALSCHVARVHDHVGPVDLPRSAAPPEVSAAPRGPDRSLIVVVAMLLLTERRRIKLGSTQPQKPFLPSMANECLGEAWPRAK